MNVSTCLEYRGDDGSKGNGCIEFMFLCARCSYDEGRENFRKAVKKE